VVNRGRALDWLQGDGLSVKVAALKEVLAVVLTPILRNEIASY
jgi:hypothetical protein